MRAWDRVLEEEEEEEGEETIKRYPDISLLSVCIFAWRTTNPWMINIQIYTYIQISIYRYQYTDINIQISIYRYIYIQISIYRYIYIQIYIEINVNK